MFDERAVVSVFEGKVVLPKTGIVQQYSELRPCSMDLLLMQRSSARSVLDLPLSI